jgi:hypothetical protein
MTIGSSTAMPRARIPSIVASRSSTTRVMGPQQYDATMTAD